ncbi:MAG: DUF1638 domain-containing protein [bacterium]
MRLKLIACEVLARELYHLSSFANHIIDIELITKDLHDYPDLLHQTLQDKLNSIQDNYDYILLGFGLCGNATANLSPPSIPLVIPRVHDCISLYLGSKERYLEQFYSFPGTYYYSRGWLERRGQKERKDSIQDAFIQELQFQDLARKYGEDNAKYLMEVMGEWQKRYNRAVFISMGIGDEREYKEYVASLAQQNGWCYEELRGSLSLLEKFCNLQLEEENFLIVYPGNEIQPSYDEKVMISKG